MNCNVAESELKTIGTVTAENGHANNTRLRCASSRIQCVNAHLSDDRPEISYDPSVRTIFINLTIIAVSVFPFLFQMSGVSNKGPNTHLFCKVFVGQRM